MPVAPNSIVTPQGPITGGAMLTAANTNYAIPTAGVVFMFGWANGARITRIWAIPCATNVACDVQLYALNGTTYRFIKAMAMPATTISAGNTQQITPVDFGFTDTNPLYLAQNEQLVGAISVANAGGIMIRGEGGAY